MLVEKGSPEQSY